MKLVLKISAEDSAKTVKHLLKTRLHISERLIKKLKRSGRIMSNSVPVHVNARVSEGDILEALIEFEEENEDIVPEKMDLDIICEDDCLIAINKPPDTVVHPTVRHFTGTVANGLRHHLLSKGVKTLIRPVSRLDRDTSGVIVFALNPYVQNELIRDVRLSGDELEPGYDAADKHFYRPYRDYYEAPEDHEVLDAGEGVVLDEPLLAENVYKYEFYSFLNVVETLLILPHTKELDQVVNVVCEKAEGGYYKDCHYYWLHILSSPWAGGRSNPET